jgi:1,4-alpha-glucan branching enzyme
MDDRKRTEKDSKGEPTMKNWSGVAMKNRPRKKRITFAVKAPEARSVFITGSFCDWKLDCFPMNKDNHGNWTATLPVGPGQHEYRFLVDGEWQDDSVCTARVPNPFGTHNCVLFVPEL